MVSVLLTRPQTTSAHLAKELQRQGYLSVIEPLLTISPTAAEQPKAHHVQAVMITSANALSALEENDDPVTDLLGLPCFCVGPRTADKARAFGFRHTFTATSDGVDLARLIQTTLSDPQKPLLHIAGRDVDSKAFNELRGAGFDVVLWPVYKAEPASHLTDRTVKLFQQQGLNAILLFSPRTAATLESLLLQYALQACCRHIIAIGLSEAVIDVLKSLPWQKRIAASAPTEDAMITCLKETLPLS